ncbi:hypothetical protein VMCG_04312 [Cytospora schulzeri]|uniref:Small EDRK-rich factor-like N-terminal domain-containing protein n=1 Tax=Cytospora schulzeri TaxID=448051 RepID=A0A423WTB6_9PEZI|nr:hypothetical protein VMCG_04312 [Valsa malicola]
MARGNQREKAREANQKKMSQMKSKNAKTGSEMQRDKEDVAAKMREKQRLGRAGTMPTNTTPVMVCRKSNRGDNVTADERKAAEAAAAAKK